jgi:hypothetical protein
MRLTGDEPTRGGARERTPRAALVLAWALVAVAALFAIRQAIVIPHGTDLGFLWVAGRMWAEGRDPYSAAYTAESTRWFATAVGWKFFYPPQWWGILRPLGLLSFEATGSLWRVGSVLCLAATGILMWREAHRWSPPAGLAARIGFLIVLLSSENIGGTFHLDQTSLLMLLGFALILIGAAPGRIAIGATGFFILMLKPSIGLPMMLAGLATAPTRRALVWAIVATAVACLPQLTDGIGAAFERAGNFLHNTVSYNDPSGWNAPKRMTGLIHLLPAIPSIFTVGLSGLVALSLAIRLRALDPGASAAPAMLLAASAAISAIAPLHTYDLVITVCAILLLDRVPRPAAACILAGVLFIHSAKRIGGLYADGDALVIAQAHFDTLGGWLLLAAAIVTAAAGWRPAPTSR